MHGAKLEELSSGPLQIINQMEQAIEATWTLSETAWTPCLHIFNYYITVGTS